MGFPWKKVWGGVKAGAAIGDMLNVPGADILVRSIHIVEDIPGIKGAQKKDAAIAIARELAGEFVTDPDVAPAVSAFIDAYVALANAYAAKKGQ
jgi:hypothetical protein